MRPVSDDACPKTTTFAVATAGSAEARWAMARYFEELAARLPGRFDPGAAVDEAAVQYDPPNGRFVLARAGIETVGCGAVAFLDDETAEIRRMWVAARHRGLGVGGRLLARLEDEARLGGRSRVVLFTNESLTEAIAMYESSGYVATGRYNDNPYAERWFTKAL